MLREVRLTLVLLFTDQIIKCRPSVFLGFFTWFVLYWAHHGAGGAGYNVCSAGERHEGFFLLTSIFSMLPGCPNCVLHTEGVGETGPVAQGTTPLLCCPLLR